MISMPTIGLSARWQGKTGSVPGAFLCKNAMSRPSVKSWKKHVNTTLFCGKQGKTKKSRFVFFSATQFE
jgi:hypothetical protein